MVRCYIASLKLLVLVSVLLWGLVAFSVVRQVGNPFPGFRCEVTLSVSPQNLSSWNGPRSGLASYDRLTAANGRRLVTYEDLERIIRTVPAGTPITYDLLRKGETKRVTVPTQTLTWLDVGRGFAPTLLVGLLQLLIGAAAFWLKPTHPAARAHLLLAASIGIGYQTLGVDFTWGHLFPWLYTGAVSFIAAAAIHLALVFPTPIRLLRDHPWRTALVYVPACALATIALLGFQPVGILAYVPPRGILAHYLPLWSVWTVLGFAVLVARAGFVAFKAPRPLARAQGRMLIAGATIAYLPGMLAYVIPVGLHQTTELSMATIMGVYMCFILFPLAVAFAILRHQLFAIDLVLKRTVTYSLLGVLLVGLYALTSMFAHWLLGPQSETTHVVATTLLIVAVIPLHKACLYVMDRYFFREPYSFTDVVTRFAEDSADLRDPDRLMALYLAILGSALNPSYAAIVLRDPASGTLAVGASSGLPEAALEPLKDFLQANPEVAPPGAFLERALGAAWPGTILIGGLKAQDDVLGVVVVGERKSDLEFAPQDKLLLANLSHQLGLTLRNASLFAEALQRNQQLEAMNRTLRELDQLKCDFLNATSHELRTPLASIIGYSEFLEDGVGGELTPDQAHFVSQIQEGGLRLKRLVEDLLDFTRLESGTLQLVPREADLAQSIRQVVHALQPQLRAARLRIEEPTLDGSLSLTFDPERIEQVLFNLLGNAIKFTPEGGTLSVSLACDPTEARVAVRDTGIGIAPEHLPHLFDKFYQVDPGSTRRFGGLGLGLSISRSIVEAHGGILSVESTPGSGSCFSFTLPLSGVWASAGQGLEATV